MGDLSPLSYNLSDSGWYEITLRAIDTVCGLQDEIKDSVLVYPTPLADFVFSPNNATNQVIHFTNQSQSEFETIDGDLTYHWDFGDGATSMEKDPQHLYPETGVYQTRLYTFNRVGCMDTMTQMISETIVPHLDMPKAFTPNGDGVNDHIAPRAFGVEKIDFRIYNRWGELVFQSDDPSVTYLENKGWNGTYKGKSQEMDVYAYVLNIVFNDGSKATKQGSITLIR
jgi:gliding motility-associated-like protein